MNEQKETAVQLFQSIEHPCSYLAEQQAQNLVIDPQMEKTPWMYGQLIELGFRRSGTMIYRPNCATCEQCIPIRIAANQFKPNRSQRRTWKRCTELITVIDLPAIFNTEHFALFQKYLNQRHADGEMCQMNEVDYMQFLACNWLDTRFIEFRIEEKLIGIVVTDPIPDGLSAVYTYFDPDYSHLALGVFAVLWQIESCKQQNKPWIYLGYWIKACSKMSYKSNYKPHQAFLQNRWLDQTELEGYFRDIKS